MTTTSSPSPTSPPRRSAKNAQYAFTTDGHIQPSAKRNKKRPTHTAKNHRHASTSQKKPPVRRRPVPAAAHREWVRHHRHRHRHRYRHGSALHLQWFFRGILLHLERLLLQRPRHRPLLRIHPVHIRQRMGPRRIGRRHRTRHIFPGGGAGSRCVAAATAAAGPLTARPRRQGKLIVQR
jgi:hypothetical protein